MRAPARLHILAAPLLLFSCSSGGSPASPSAGTPVASLPEEGSPALDASSIDVDSATDPLFDASVSIPVVGVDAAACPPRPSTGDFPPEVAAVIHDRCQTCHKKPPIDHAPFPLLSYEDTLAPDPSPPFAGEPIWEAMSVVIQPGAVPHMPFGNAPQLSAAEYQTLHAWLFACAMPVATTRDDSGTD